MASLDPIASLGANSEIVRKEFEVDGFPSKANIKKMNKEALETAYAASKKSGLDGLNFLAKAAIASLELGYAQEEGRNLIAKVVELYARNMGVDPLNLKIDHEKVSLPSLSKDLLMRALGYAYGIPRSELSLLVQETRNAFIAWIIFEQVISTGANIPHD